jgi:hypothetical protein
MRPRSSIRRTLWTLLVLGIAVPTLCLLCAGLLQVAIEGHGDPRGIVCKNNLSNFGKALHNYNSSLGSFPPAFIADANGKPMHSWRTLLLPYLDEPQIRRAYRFDEPWDSPHNWQLQDRSLNFSRCRDDESPENQTTYVAIVGPGTMWPGAHPCTVSEFADGTSNTIMLVEVPNSGIPWLEPRDLTAAELKSLVLGRRWRERPRNHHSGGHVLMADASVHWLSDEDLLKYLDALISINGNDSIAGALDNQE